MSDDDRLEALQAQLDTMRLHDEHLRDLARQCADAQANYKAARETATARKKVWDQLLEELQQAASERPTLGPLFEGDEPDERQQEPATGHAGDAATLLDWEVDEDGTLTAISAKPYDDNMAFEYVIRPDPDSVSGYVLEGDAELVDQPQPRETLEAAKAAAEAIEREIVAQQETTPQPA